jgi:pyruvate-formate lyase-activating enzyme
MPLAGVKAGIRRMRRRLPGNRLREHLEHCALVYGCPAGKNFFLGRYEAPLPTSSRCNARCLGCLSLQPEGSGIPCSQRRIAFTPTPQEIADLALVHLRAVPRAVVSFGQGCEGDPLLAAATIAPAIARIRAATRHGTINLNTNGSLPAALDTLLDAGLDSLRVSLNSLRPETYRAYFRPSGYTLEDVRRSVALALARGRIVCLNYLNLPGFSDTPAEAAALVAFLETHPVHMIQWRNLNFDPLRYLEAMGAAAAGAPIGMEALLRRIRSAFPAIRFGYFNPPREAFTASRRTGKGA